MVHENPGQGGSGMLHRLVPDYPLPCYTYVPGRFPHPISDPAGHSFGVSDAKVSSFDPEKWQTSHFYLYGIDLFNSGYYWEAHETWETLWRLFEKGDRTGDFLNVLILIAAAGVKAYEGNLAGIARHLNKAQRHLDSVFRTLTATNCWMGLSYEELRDITVQPMERLPLAEGKVPPIRFYLGALTPQSED